MDRDEAIGLLRRGPEGIAKWNNQHQIEEGMLDLSGADLRGAELRGVDLSCTNLRRCDLSGADLSGADLHGASLTMANFRGAELTGTQFGDAHCGATLFVSVDLSGAKGLDSVEHDGPSTIGTDTLFRSGGKIPEAFLRGCGLPDELISYLPSLIGSMSPIEFYSCFISHSSKDTPFAERIYAGLQSKGVRCWYAPKDLKIGENFRIGIDESIRIHDKLLLVLSKNSVRSQWVADEVESAMERERNENRLVLLPIRLDDSVTRIKAGWPAAVRRSRHIGDFRQWRDDDAYHKSFDRLLKDLKDELKSTVAAPSHRPARTRKPH